MARIIQERGKLLPYSEIWLQAQPAGGASPPLTSCSPGSALHTASRSSSACGCCPSTTNTSARHSRRELASGAAKRNVVTRVMIPCALRQRGWMRPGRPCHHGIAPMLQTQLLRSSLAGVAGLIRLSKEAIFSKYLVLKSLRPFPLFFPHLSQNALSQGAPPLLLGSATLGSGLSSILLGRSKKAVPYMYPLQGLLPREALQCDSPSGATITRCQTNLQLQRPVIQKHQGASQTHLDATALRGQRGNQQGGAKICLQHVTWGFQV